MRLDTGERGLHSNLYIFITCSDLKHSLIKIIILCLSLMDGQTLMKLNGWTDTDET